MSHKTRLAKLERVKAFDALLALIGIGKHASEAEERRAEMKAREEYKANGGDRNAKLTFLPFEGFDMGFIGYIKSSEFRELMMNKSKNPAEMKL